MGKLVTYLSILITVDLLFLITGQLGLTSPTSIIINAFLNPESITSSQLWILFITGGIGLLTAAVTVAVGIVTRSFDLVAFIPMALALAALIGDFVTIFVYLSSFNIVLATLVMAPIMMLFALTIVEWLRGKD